MGNTIKRAMRIKSYFEIATDGGKFDLIAVPRRGNECIFHELSGTLRIQNKNFKLLIVTNLNTRCCVSVYKNGEIQSVSLNYEKKDGKDTFLGMEYIKSYMVVNI